MGGHGRETADNVADTGAPAPTRRRRTLQKARVEAFSDGVFAIAATLLVLEIGVPLGAGGDLFGALLALWPSYLAYVISFLTIGWVWIGHTAIIAHIVGVDRLFLRLNLALLMAVAFLPFPTKLMGEYIGQSEPERVAVVLYGMLLLVIAGLLAWMWRYVLEARDLRHPDVSDEELEGLRRKSMPGIAIFVGAIAVSLLVPTFGVLLYLAASIFLVVPFQTIRRALTRPR